MFRFIGIALLAVAFGSGAQAAAFDCQDGKAKPATTIGAYSFKQVCQNKGAGKKEHSVAYPQIISGDATAAKWNAAVAKTATTVFADQGASDFDTSDISYSIGTASAKLISLHFEFYANTEGTAHPSIAVAHMNTVLPMGAPLKATDMFKVTPQWKTFMANQLGAAFTQLSGMSVKDAGIENDTLVSQATDPGNWLIDAKGLNIETGDLVSAPNSDVKATVSWAALKPYLAANAPAQ
jgi:hypothetical protein